MAGTIHLGRRTQLFQCQLQQIQPHEIGGNPHQLRAIVAEQQPVQRTGIAQKSPGKLPNQPVARPVGDLSITQPDSGVADADE